MLPRRSLGYLLPSSWAGTISIIFSGLLKSRLKTIQQSARTNQSAIFSITPNDSSEAREVPATVSQIQSTKDDIIITTSIRECHSQRSKRALCNRLVDSFRENYCPQTSPPLVLPTPPTDVEKNHYVNMKRPFLLTCGTFALLAVAVGGWMFAKTSPIYSWFAAYVLLSESYLFTALFITAFGRNFDLAAHHELLGNFPLTENEAPSIDVFITVCNEPLELIENTCKYIAALHYSSTKRRIYILDDGTDEAVRSLAQHYHFDYISRPDRPTLKKAGNIRHAFTKTTGKYFVVFDADFCPRPDLLLESIPYLQSDPHCALLQTPQFFHSLPSQTWTEQGAGAVQEYIYRILQPCRDRWGAAICVGSNAIFRREALEPICGAFPANESEDIETGFWAVANGWKLKFLPLNLACGKCPDTPRSYFSQQVRWCTGSVQLCTRREFWTSSLTVVQKLCYLTSFLYYVGQAVQPFLSQLPAPLVLWTKPGLFKYYNLFFAVPSILLELVALRIWARGRYTLAVQYVHVLMSFSYLQSIFDLIKGTKPVWQPAGVGSRMHKGVRYRNMRILGWIWAVGLNAALLSAIVYRILGGLPWYNVVPVLVIDAYNLLCMHRFLLFQHPKD